MLRFEEDFAKHVDYIHWNPVKHGCVKRVIDWPHSSFHQYMVSGVYAEDCAEEVMMLRVESNSVSNDALRCTQHILRAL